MKTSVPRDEVVVNPGSKRAPPPSLKFWRRVALAVLFAWLLLLFRDGALQLLFWVLIMPPVFLPLGLNLWFVLNWGTVPGPIEFRLCVIGTVLNAILFPFVYEQTGHSPSLIAH